MALFGLSRTEFSTQAVSHTLTDPDQPLFTINTGVVVAVDPYSHVYGIAAYPTLKNVPPLPAVALGARGNTRRGVQLQTSYYVGDLVLYIRQINDVTNPVSSLAYIIGSATTDYIRVQEPEELVSASRWDSGNVDELSIDVFNKMLTKARLIEDLPYMTGHGGIDMPPGAYEAAGKLISLIMDDYFGGIRATAAELLVSGLDRRIIERSMLRTVSTVNSLDDIAILNTSTITTHKTCGNVNDAWYDYVQEDQDEIIVKTDNAAGSAPGVAYRDITQTGDILYGTHRVLLNQDHDTPLYTDFLGMDGTRKELSASRMILGKRPGLKATEYIGDRLNTEENTPKYDTKNIDEPVKIDAGKSKVSKNWSAYYDDYLFPDFNNYPDFFVPTDQGEYSDEDIRTKKIKDDITGQEIELKSGSCTLEFEDDGSIKLVDAWGSYIYMSHGNVEIHAVNNLFMTSARDTLMFAGHNRTDYAGVDIAVQAYKGELREMAGKHVHLYGSATGDEGGIILESAHDVRVIADNTKIDSLNVFVHCHNPRVPAVQGGGVFQVLVPGGKLNLAADIIRQSGTAISLTSDTHAFVLSGSVTIVGDLLLHGGIHSWTQSPQISVIRTDGTTEDKKFQSGSNITWVNEMGGMKLNSHLSVNGQMMASGQVLGQSIFSIHKQEQVYQASGRGSLLASIRNMGGSKPSTNFKVNNTKPFKIESLKDIWFTFGDYDIGCVYRVAAPYPGGMGKWLETDGFEPPNTRDKSYIYPGASFWTDNGILDLTVKTGQNTRGFKYLMVANINEKG
jgi:hypothetical protein